MKAKCGDEVSHLSLTTLFGFPPKLLKAFIRRIILKYFLFDLISSLYILFGFPLFIIGLIYGIIKYISMGAVMLQLQPVLLLSQRCSSLWASSCYCQQQVLIFQIIRKQKIQFQNDRTSRRYIPNYFNYS
jgi:hypothetical protein